jgi:hypothetical protein
MVRPVVRIHPELPQKALQISVFGASVGTIPLGKKVYKVYVVSIRQEVPAPRTPKIVAAISHARPAWTTTSGFQVI